MLMSELSQQTGIPEATLIEWHRTFSIEYHPNPQGDIFCRSDVRAIIDDIKCLKDSGIKDDAIRPEVRAREAGRRKQQYEQRVASIKDDGTYKIKYDKLHAALLDYVDRNPSKLKDTYMDVIRKLANAGET